MKFIKPLFQIGQSVIVNDTQQEVRIVDIEIYESLILCYTNDGKAYPENKLMKKKQYLGMLGVILRSESEWNQLVNDFMKSRGLI